MFAKSALCLAALAALSTVSGQSASAAVITISSHVADGIIQNGNAQDAGEGEMRVGLLGGSNFRVVILMFQLPVLAPGETVTNAVLNTRFGSKSNTPLFNIDVYATRVAAGSPSMNNGLDWGFGASPGGTLIQNDLVTPSTVLGGDTLISTNSTGNANLLSYVNSNYVAGRYVYLRFNPDVAQTNAAIGGDDAAYRVYSANWTSGGSRVAQLELTTVIPEPATLGLVGLAATLGMARRRRA